MTMRRGAAHLQPFVCVLRVRETALVKGRGNGWETASPTWRRTGRLWWGASH